MELEFISLPLGLGYVFVFLWQKKKKKFQKYQQKNLTLAAPFGTVGEGSRMATAGVQPATAVQV